jgi:predicted nucleic acid-binding protein
MIVLDTNILSELMRPAPEAAVEQWLADQPEASVFISAITEAELRYGAKIMPPGKRQAVLGLCG